MNFWHRLMNPHCEDCNRCKSCETLEKELAHVREDYDKLLNELLRKPESEPERAQVETEIPKPKYTPWAVKRQLLEAEDREKAKIQRETEKLERDMKLEVKA